MTGESKKLEGLTRRGFLKSLARGAAAGAAALTGINCASGSAWSDWPGPKRSRSSEKHYDVHYDDPFAKFGLRRRRENETIFDFLSFNSSFIESDYKLGRQTVLRLARGCGAENHNPDCMIRSMRGIHKYDDLKNQAVLVTLRKRTLHYVLENDNTSFMDIEYDPYGSKDSTPMIKVTTYRIGKDGKVKNPLPESGHGNWNLKIRHLGDVVTLHNFLIGRFNRDSIFTEDDVFEAEYFSDPDKGLERLEGLAEYLYTWYAKDKFGEKAKPLAERASMLVDYSRRYRRISDRDPRDNIDRRADAQAVLIVTYRKLIEEYMNGAWKEGITEGQKDTQSMQIRRQFEAVRKYLNIKD